MGFSDVVRKIDVVQVMSSLHHLYSCIFKIYVEKIYQYDLLLSQVMNALFSRYTYVLAYLFVR